MPVSNASSGAFASIVGFILGGVIGCILAVMGSPYRQTAPEPEVRHQAPEPKASAPTEPDAALKTELTRLRTEHAEAQQTIRSLQGQLHEVRTARKKLGDQLKEAQKKFADLRKTLAAQNSEARPREVELQRQIDTLTAQLHLLQQRYDVLLRDYITLKKQALSSPR